MEIGFLKLCSSGNWTEKKPLIWFNLIFYSASDLFVGFILHSE